MKKHTDHFDAAEAREQNLVGRRIAAARRDAGMSLAGLSRALAGCGVHIRDKGLSKWEQGQTVPNAYQLMAACRVLDIADLLSGDMPALNDAGLRKLSEYREDLIASGRYEPPRPTAEGPEPIYIDMPLYRLSVSAGAGMFLDGDDYETVSVPRSTVPGGAAFGLRVSGDSMEPVYRDGQLVWVQPCGSLRPGEVGIFVCDGEGFIKAYGEQEPSDPQAFADSYGAVRKQPVLISFNKKYPPRVVSPDMSFRIVGRVLR